jgi:glucose-6-phosphate isomerase
MSNKPISQRAEWAALETHHAAIKTHHMRDLFEKDPQRFDKLHIEIPGLLFDYSKQLINEETPELLCALALSADIHGAQSKMLAGEPLNASEGRAALHMALRGTGNAALTIAGENVADFVHDTLIKIETLSDKIRANPKITDIVNIGIGGSELGPRVVCRALQPYTDGPCVHFLSNIDGSAISDLLELLQPESTLFIIASKTFTTDETLTNACTAKAWLSQALSADKISDHLMAVTLNISAAKDFGVPPTHIVEMRDWIGGRFSLWGAVGLPIAIACGFENFQSLLEGAHVMDEHFLNAPFEKNIPVMLALIGVWNRNFCGHNALAVLPYAEDLEFFSTYVQQIDMESNGKSVTSNGHSAACATGPIVFGQSGTNAQHAFMQHLHQSEEIIPSEFILIAQMPHALPAHHARLIGNALAQSKALMEGHTNTAEPHRNFPGNRPSVSLVLDHLDPFHLGMLMALYEHKIFVQGVLWNINSFDQWGVELGKIIAQSLITHLEDDQAPKDSDSSTNALMAHILKKDHG